MPNVSLLFLLCALCIITEGYGQNIHANYGRLLAKYVDAKGDVNYRAWHGNEKDIEALRTYLSALEGVLPTALSHTQALVYYINLYNAHTLSLVLSHYPLQSIKDIEKEGQSAWDIPLIVLGGEKEGRKYSLNDIEHNIIRKRFAEPRIHFALVCAAKGCPILQNRAYREARVEAQLNRALRVFLTDSAKNRIEEAKLSPLFDWYKEDFEQEGMSVADYIFAAYGKRLPSGVSISYLEYDWSLNTQ